MTAQTMRYLEEVWSDEEERTPEVPPRPQGGNREAVQVSGRPARILVADDDPAMRGLLASSLRRDGYDVVEAANGAEMLEAFSLMLFRGEPVPIDVVVSDERMPGLLGSEVLAGLREAAWPTPFILITGFGSEETHRQMERLGATTVFDKPFDLDDLKDAIVEVLLGRNRVPRRTLDGN